MSQYADLMRALADIDPPDFRLFHEVREGGDYTAVGVWHRDAFDQLVARLELKVSSDGDRITKAAIHYGDGDGIHIIYQKARA